MIGYICAVLVGCFLGLMGGGGSIFFIPVLVYILKLDPKVSIALSLALVGMTSLIGAINHYRNDNINFRIILFFAPFTMLGAYLGSYLALFISGQIQLILFSLTVLFASFLMIKDQNNKGSQKAKHQLIFILSGFVIGVVSGIVGIGGGFLIVPLLIILADLSMKQAVGTSLAIISLSSLTGFSGYIGQLQIPWFLLFQFVFLSGIGVILGSHFIQYISHQKLKKSFGYFLIVMGFFMLIQNFYKN